MDLTIRFITYTIAVLLSFVSGTYVAWGTKRYYDEKTVFTKEFFTEFKKGIPKHLLSMLIMLGTYVLITMVHGNFYNLDGSFSFIKLIQYIKYLVLAPLMLIVFFTDIEYRVIPNRVNMLLLQLGIIFTIILGSFNILLATDGLLGMAIGFGVFAALALLGGIIVGKEAMGVGDIKLMAPLGLFLGKVGMLNTILAAFILGAIVSIGIVIYRHIKKEQDQYIPFGPFLVFSAMLVILLPENIIMLTFINVATLFTNLVIGENLGK